MYVERVVLSQCRCPQMSGNVLAYLERIDDEFYKSLQVQTRTDC